jgi:hypothetical protein
MRRGAPIPEKSSGGGAIRRVHPWSDPIPAHARNHRVNAIWARAISTRPTCVFTVFGHDQARTDLRACALPDQLEHLAPRRQHRDVGDRRSGVAT